MGHMRTHRHAHTQELFFPDSTACDPGGEPGWTTEPLSHWSTDPLSHWACQRCGRTQVQRKIGSVSGCLCVCVCVGLQYIFISLYGRKTIRGKKWAVVVSLSVWHVTWKQEVLRFRREVREKRKKYRSVCLRLKKMLSCITKNNEKRNLTPPVGCTCTIQEVFLLGLVDK